MYYAGQVGKRLPVPILQAIDSFLIFGALLLIERYYRDRPSASSSPPPWRCGG